ncbi:MAG: FkbM family methyltransferase [Lachnospiraceae bacterium]|nr:FkbM family methyltransferase [Lachnospiraceae bacterium]
MNIGTIVFAYNRSEHLQQVLDGLQKNDGVDKLYIFQDGLRCEAEREDWEATQHVIQKITFCETVYELSKENKGLARSIVYGINKVFQENDAVIVLEDDCVPQPAFISFMKQCFEKYRDNDRVYSVSGYSWPIQLSKEDGDIYFCGRISSWGWGTWRNRWQQYKQDNAIIKRIKNQQDASLNLAMWGTDLEDTVLGNIRGVNDSWAVYWALNVIERNGLCINPYKSLIKNIGMDGTGVHCGVTNRFDVSVEGTDSRQKFCLPDNADIQTSTQLAFAELHGCYAALPSGESREKAVIYGLGTFYATNEKEINQRFEISAFIDRRKRGWYAGKEIMVPADIQKLKYDKIIIMLQNIRECINVSKRMIDQYGVDYKQIILGHSLYGHYAKCFQSINVLQDGNLSVSAKGICVKVGSLGEFNNVYEVLIAESYHYYINNSKKDVVLDIGMNIGDATLYFLNQNKVEKVYAYEPFCDTYLAARNNLKDYIGNQNKVEIFQYGISGKNEKREQIEVRSASEVFAPIFKRHTKNNIILKIDCEGKEYDIFENLTKAGLLGKFDIIMLKWHCQGKEILLEYLQKAGFSYWCNDKNMEMGLIYAYKTKDLEGI